jgi:hypothetical protein
MEYSETQNDIKNTEAWAEIISEILLKVPQSQRAEVLALAEKIDRERPKMYRACDIDWDAPGGRHWNAIFRLKSLLLQVFVRDIRNNNDPDIAKAILFAEHPHGNASGRLRDYMRYWLKPKGEE